VPKLQKFSEGFSGMKLRQTRVPSPLPTWHHHWLCYTYPSSRRCLDTSSVRCAERSSGANHWRATSWDVRRRNVKGNELDSDSVT